MGVDLNSHTAFEFVAKQETASRGPQHVALGIQKVGRGRTVSRVLFSPSQIRYSEYGTAPSDTERHDVVGY